MKPTRKELNLELVDLLVDAIERHPDGRFHQILINLCIGHSSMAFDGSMVEHTLSFYEESEDTLNRVYERRNKR